MRKTHKYIGSVAAAAVLLASFAQSANIEHFKYENSGLQPTYASGQLLAQVSA